MTTEEFNAKLAELERLEKDLDWEAPWLASEVLSANLAFCCEFIAASRNLMRPMIDRIRELEKKHAKQEREVNAILDQDRRRGYPTGKEWLELVRLAKG